jgi:2Fe-2S ferredoxin
MAKEECSLMYYNEYGEECYATFGTNEHHSLMELLFDKYIEDWGDCKGRAWCVTCHIQIIKGSVLEKMGGDEKQTLFKIGNSTRQSRLAWRIPVTSQLDGIIFEILKANEV